MSFDAAEPPSQSFALRLGIEILFRIALRGGLLLLFKNEYCGLEEGWQLIITPCAASDDWGLARSIWQQQSTQKYIGNAGFSSQFRAKLCDPAIGPVRDRLLLSGNIVQK